jgi:hypothetical protein
VICTRIQRRAQLGINEEKRNKKNPKRERKKKEKTRFSHVSTTKARDPELLAFRILDERRRVDARQKEIRELVDLQLEQKVELVQIDALVAPHLHRQRSLAVRQRRAQLAQQKRRHKLRQRVERREHFAHADLGRQIGRRHVVSRLQSRRQRRPHKVDRRPQLGQVLHRRDRAVARLECVALQHQVEQHGGFSNALPRHRRVLWCSLRRS